MSIQKRSEQGQHLGVLPADRPSEVRTGARLLGWAEERANWLLAAGIFFYIVVFAAAACYKYWAYWMGFDLAVHLQLLWNTGQGRIAASSPSAGTSSYFGIDIIITELLLAPLYRLVPSPYLLLTLQTVVLALGAVPVFLYARERLETPLAGLAFGAAYLLYAPVEWMNLYEFQIRAFATTFLLCALYALYRRRAGRFFLWALLALGCRADVGLVLAGVGAAGIVDCRLQIADRALQRDHRQSRICNLQSALVVLLGLGWTLLATQVLVPSFRTDGQFLYTKVIYGWLGDTPGAMVRRLLTDPGYVLGYVFGPPRGGERLRYLLEMFLPFAFLPLLAPRWLLPALPIFALNLLSNTPQLHASTHYHYQALVIPFMLVAAVEGLRKIQKPRTEDREPQQTGKTTFGSRFSLLGSRFSLLGSRFSVLGSRFSLLASRFSLLASLCLLALVCNIGFRNPLMSLVTRPVAYERNEAAAELLALVPPDAAVAATNSLGPRLAHREQLYVFPGDDIIYPVAYAERADYLAVDSAELDADDRAYFDTVRQSGRYQLVERRVYSYRGQEHELSVWRRIAAP